MSELQKAVKMFSLLIVEKQIKPEQYSTAAIVPGACQLPLMVSML